MYVIYPADDLISLLITREYTQRRTRSGISPVVPPTPEATRESNENLPYNQQYINGNNIYPSSSSTLPDNQQFQFETQHQHQSDIFSEQRRDQHTQGHFSDSRENSLERYFFSEVQREQTVEPAPPSGAAASSSSSSAGARAVSAAIFQHSTAANKNIPQNHNNLRARSITPVQVERSVSALAVDQVAKPFIKEGSTETITSSSKTNKPKRSVSFHTFDRKNSTAQQQSGLLNGQPPSVVAVTTSRLNLNRRVSPAPDLVETRQGFGSNTNINSNTNSPSGGSKSNSLIKKGKSWLPRITFSIQEEREEHPTPPPPPAGATSAPTPSTSSSSSHHHQHHHHRHHHPQSQDHHHNQGTSPGFPSHGSASTPVEFQDSFAEFLGKSYRGAANSSSASKLQIQQQSGPQGSKGQRGVSPGSGSISTPTSGHQRFAFLNNSGKGGSGGTGGAASSSSAGPGGGAIAAGLGSMAGVNGGVTGIGSMLSLGISHHGAGHIMAGQLVDANSLKDCVHPSLNESLKTHNSLSFKVIRIGEYFLFFCIYTCASECYHVEIYLYLETQKCAIIPDNYH